MFSVSVRDHFMIAHSFKGAVFGPAQNLHGATYVIDVEFRRPALDADGIVVDIGKASETLRTIIAEVSYRNLDDEPLFTGHNTTTEFLAHVLWQRIARQIESGALGASARGVTALRVTLHESPAAWAAFEAPLANTRRP